ncbi:type II toxin-antitoxin system Phd/YefM family antitoxin [Rickettsiales endosymbiont of Peranema trichophorum]|uniref:type II toxin-antitoxin system Phd/YefM family antitoxin n=1 Tax=Rickettsiales endosymbiont of Peranema trichophorum TaxID=2486577 RepID=UPI001A92FF2F
MQVTNIHNAKTNFSKFLKLVAAGEEVIICSSNKPIAKLISYKTDNIPRIPGILKTKISIKKDFNVLPEDFLKFFK